jgi:hypothetical protein
MNVYKNITLSAKTDLFLAYIPDCQAFTVGPTPATTATHQSSRMKSTSKPVLVRQ